jgi:hypothetical protein
VEVENEKGEIERRCPLYPGMTCRQHLGAAVDIDNARGDDLVKVPFLELHPNTWLVLPDRKVVRVEEKDQFVAKAIRKQVKEIQKELGDPLPPKLYEPVRALVKKGDAALEEEAYRDALEAWAALERRVGDEMHAPMKALLEQRLAALAEDAMIYAEDFLESEDEPSAEDVAEARALLTSLDVKVLGRYVPARDALKARLEALSTKEQ